jgi:hypothetical protein
MTTPSDKIEQDNLTLAQRWAGLYTTVLMLLLLAFFGYHQWAKTGFFTVKFDRAGMLALYGPIVISLVPPIQRLIQGRRNPARPLEAITDLSLALGSLWLRNIFPFNFAHLADPFPPAMRFAFVWLTDDAGRFILLLQTVIGFISAISIIATYSSTRRKQTGMMGG